VKGAKALEIAARLAQGHNLSHHFDDVDAVEQFVDKVSGDTASHVFRVRFREERGREPGPF
jgi:hypothetical protein